MQNIFVVSILIAASIGWTYACSCQGRKSTEEYYCASSFAIQFNVTSDFQFEGSVGGYYNILVEKIFKGDQNAITHLATGRLQTSQFSSLCGVVLVENEVYVMTGYVYRHGAQVSSCDYLRSLSDVAAYDLKGFNGIFKDKCAV